MYSLALDWDFLHGIRSPRLTYFLQLASVPVFDQLVDRSTLETAGGCRGNVNDPILGQASFTSINQVKPSESTVDLESLYADELEQINRLRDTGNLLERRSEMLLNTTLLALVMFSHCGYLMPVPRTIAPNASIRWLLRL